MRIRCINSWVEAAGEAARKQQIPTALLHPDTVVDFVSVANRPAGTISSYYEAAIMDMYVAQAGLSAESDGYDAVVIDSISDPAVPTLRSRLSIPVVGAGLSSYLTALLIGRRFAILSYLDEHNLFYERVLASHGLLGHCVSIRSLHTDPDHANLLAVDESHKLDLLERAASRAIEIDRADVLVLGSVSMHSVVAALRSRVSAPIVDPSVTSFLDAERLVRLGLAQSKIAYRSPEVDQDVLWSDLGPSTS